MVILFIALFMKGTTINYTTITNSYQFTDPSLVDHPLKSAEIIKKEETLDCPIFQLPEIKPEPELSSKDLEKINPNNSKAVDRLIMKHITDLTLYIREYQKQLQESYSQYIGRCQK